MVQWSSALGPPRRVLLLPSGIGSFSLNLIQTLFGRLRDYNLVERKEGGVFFSLDWGVGSLGLNLEIIEIRE